MTLLKAVLKLHKVVALVEKQLPYEHTGPQLVDAAMAEVDLRGKLRWKENQVSQLWPIHVFCSRHVVHI